MYNRSSCPSATKGSYEPIELPRGLVQFPNTSYTLSEYSGIVAEIISAAGNATFDCTLAECTARQVDEDWIRACPGDGFKPISIGIGVSLGATLLFVIGGLLWQWRRARKLALELEELRLQCSKIKTKQTRGMLPYSGDSQELSAKESSRESELPFDNAIVEMPPQKE